MSLRPDKTDAQHGVKRSRRACLNCRRKKVKCYGELPECSFCKRLGQVCRYPHVSHDLPNVQPVPSDIIPSASNFEFKFFDSRLDQLERKLTSFSTEPVGYQAFDNSNVGPDTLDWSLSNSDAPLYDFAPSVESSSSDVNAKFMPQSLSPPRTRADTSTLNLSSRANYSNLPPLASQQLAIDTYFMYCHNQAYSFFHEQNFRHQFANGRLPEYIILAVIAGTLRFSHDPYYGSQHAAAADKCAAAAWKAIMSQCFDSEEGPSYRVVQAMTLIGVHDFICCRHGPAWVKIGIACSVAQALHMMVEPPSNLACATREEYRRTLWSIYLLDKLATCGRYRPAIFQDESLRLQLPCPEASFRASISEKLLTLGAFNNSAEPEMDNLGSVARCVVVTSTLSRIAHYVFQAPGSVGERLPWDHNSDFTVLSSKLTWFATYFDSHDSIELAIMQSCAENDIVDLHSAEPFIFSHVVYHICHCLLQHPFLLRQKLATVSTAKFPSTFFLNAIKTNWKHAQKITDTLAYTRRAGYKVAASFYGYCSLIAGTINALHRYSTDEDVRAKSMQGLALNQAFLKEHARYFKNSARMDVVLDEFVRDAEQYQLLISPSCQKLELDESDTERLYSVVDYGTMSTTSKFGKSGSDDEDIAATNNPQAPSPGALGNNFTFGMMNPVWNFGVDPLTPDDNPWT